MAAVPQKERAMLIKKVLTPEQLFELTKFIDDQHKNFGLNVAFQTIEEQIAWIVERTREGNLPNIVGSAHDHYVEDDDVALARILKASSFDNGGRTLFNVTVEIRAGVHLFHDYCEEKDEKYADRGAEYEYVTVPLAFVTKILTLMGVPESPE
jgi:hypothetical protein